MAKYIYTEDKVAEFVEAYVADREAGELNPNILEKLIEDEVDENGTALTVPSLRSKLMIEGVYVKDTDAEKEKLATVRERVKKAAPKRATKAEKARDLLVLLDLNVKLAEDLARVKVDTLDALTEAIAALVAAAEPAEEVVEETPAPEVEG